MSKKVLIVDDEANVVKAISMVLKGHGYTVVDANDGLQAVSKVYEEKPDLIILDIKLPIGDGISVCENLKNSNDTKDIPVIFITGYPTDEVRKKAFDLGAVDFIPKPFDTDELLKKVKVVIGE